MRLARGVTLLLTALIALPNVGRSQPIPPPGTEGLSVFTSGTNPVIARYEGNSAAFSNDLYLVLDALGNPVDDGILSNDRFLFNNQSSMVGSTVDLGTFAPGTELIFRLFVNNTGFNYYSGPASRNPDNKPHVRVQDNWLPNTTLVAFEDLFDTPEFPGGYNDLSFSFTNTSTQTVTPEPASAALLAAGLIALGAARLRRTEG